MPRPCSVCAHLARGEIDRRLAQQVVNVSAIAREYDLGRDAVTAHRARHLPEFLAAFTSTASAPLLGSLMAEYQRLYLTALDELARAQAGVLIDVGDDGVQHRRVSSTAVARSIDNVRKALDRVTHLAADAASEDSRPAGVADGELTTRIRAQLDRVMSRATSATMSIEAVDNDPLPTISIDSVGKADPRGAGGQAVEPGAPSSSSIPRDSAEPSESLVGVSSQVRHVINEDRKSGRFDTTADHTPLITIPNPRYPGNEGASAEERAAAGYPDITLTRDDLKAANPSVLAALAPEDREERTPEA